MLDGLRKMRESEESRMTLIFCLCSLGRWSYGFMVSSGKEHWERNKFRKQNQELLFKALTQKVIKYSHLSFILGWSQHVKFQVPYRHLRGEVKYAIGDPISSRD